RCQWLAVFSGIHRPARPAFCLRLAALLPQRLLKVLTGQFFLVESLEGRFEPAPQQCRDFVAGESGVAVRVEPLEESAVFARGLAGAAPLLAAQTLEVLARQLPVSEPLEQRSHPLPRPGGQ